MRRRLCSISIICLSLCVVLPGIPSKAYADVGGPLVPAVQIAAPSTHLSPQNVQDETKKAEQGDPLAQLGLGNHYYRNKQYDKAYAWFRRAATQGYAPAEWRLGALYQDGYGVSQSYKKAAKWYRSAASHGSHEAEFWLSILYISGKGVDRDGKRALELLHQSALGGYALAQYDLGSRYMVGNGIRKNPNEGLKLLRASASQGYAPADFNIGHSYEYGAGAAKDEKKAVDWFKKGAEAGDAPSQYRLGVHYMFGWGITHSFSHAYMWFLLVTASTPASSHLHHMATKALQIIEKRLNSRQVRNAKNEAAIWKKNHHSD